MDGDLITAVLENYNSGTKILSLAFDEQTLVNLFNQGLNILCIETNCVLILPEKICYPISYELSEELHRFHNFDVVGINPLGEISMLYDTTSFDNTLLITNHCNSNCLMCPVSTYVRREDRGVEDSALLELVKHIPNNSNHITITGGEPFLKKDTMLNVLELIKNNSNNVDCLLLTNGRVFSNLEYFNKFRSVCPANILIGIPLHGCTALKHDKITQTPGSFDQTVIGIKRLISCGIKVEIRVVISKLNCYDIEKIAQYIVSEFKKVYSVKFVGLEMMGNASVNSNDVWISYTEAFSKSRKSIDLLVENSIDVELYNFPLC